MLQVNRGKAATPKYWQQQNSNAAVNNIMPLSKTTYA
jgi:hypothetical protein